MVEHQLAETNAVACAICMPELANTLHEYTISPEAKAIVYALCGLSTQRNVPLVVLVQLTNINKKIVQRYYDAIVDIPEDDVEKVFESALVALKEYKRITEISTKADSIAVKIKANKLGEAYKIFEEITTLDGSEQPFNDIVTDMNNAVDRTNGFLTGIKGIDEKGGLYKSNLMSLFGDTGSMKTYISLYICFEILMKNPTFTCIYFEKEMPKEDISRRLISKVIKRKLSEIMMATFGATRDIDMANIKDLIKDEMAQDTPLTGAMNRFKLIGPNDFNTAEDMQKIIMKYKPDVWCLDYLSLLSTRGDDANEGVSNMMKTLKKTVHMSESLGILLSQLKHNTIDNRANKIPTKSDIEWGSQVKQFSANMYATFNAKKYYKRDLKDEKSWYFLVDSKSRNSVGESICLHSQPEFCNFVEVDGEEETKMREWLDGYMTSVK